MPKVSPSPKHEELSHISTYWLGVLTIPIKFSEANSLKDQWLNGLSNNYSMFLVGGLEHFFYILTIYIYIIFNHIPPGYD